MAFRRGCDMQMKRTDNKNSKLILVKLVVEASSDVLTSTFYLKQHLYIQKE